MVLRLPSIIYTWLEVGVGCHQNITPDEGEDLLLWTATTDQSTADLGILVCAEVAEHFSILR